MPVPAMPELANRCSISVSGLLKGVFCWRMIGVSGGGGEPLVAFVVAFEAVESRRAILLGSLMLSLAKAACAAFPTVGMGNEVVPGGALWGMLSYLCIGRWKEPSLSGASGPGESGRGLGALAPRLSASVDCVGMSVATGVLPEFADPALCVGSLGEALFTQFCCGDATLLGSGYW